MFVQKRHFLPLPSVLAFLGVVFSLWNLQGGSSVLCVTEGCSLFQHFTVAGISLWWLGLAGFGALLVLAVFGLATWGFVCAAFGLVLDGALLAVMLTTAPCFNCLIVGLLLALTFRAFRVASRQARYQAAPGRSPLLALWALLFVFNMGLLGHSLAGSWELRKPSGSGAASVSAPVQVYFSPSCTACLSLVRSAGGMNTAAWYPVAENSRDVWVIADMQRRMLAGADLPAALEASLAAAPQTVSPMELLSVDMLGLQLRLWRNHAHVLNAGSNRLPFVEFRGVPAGLVPASGVPVPGASTGGGALAPSVGGPTSVPPVGGPTSGHPYTGLSGLSVTGACDGDRPGQPCSEPGGAPRGSLTEIMGTPAR